MRIRKSCSTRVASTLHIVLPNTTCRYVTAFIEGRKFATRRPSHRDGGRRHTTSPTFRPETRFAHRDRSISSSATLVRRPTGHQSPPTNVPNRVIVDIVGTSPRSIVPVGSVVRPSKKRTLELKYFHLPSLVFPERTIKLSNSCRRGWLPRSVRRAQKHKIFFATDNRSGTNRRFSWLTAVLQRSIYWLRWPDPDRRSNRQRPRCRRTIASTCRVARLFHAPLWVLTRASCSPGG